MIRKGRCLDQCPVFRENFMHALPVSFMLYVEWSSKWFKTYSTFLLTLCYMDFGLQIASAGYWKARHILLTGPSPLQEWLKKPECLQQFNSELWHSPVSINHCISLEQTFWGCWAAGYHNLSATYCIDFKGQWWQVNGIKGHSLRHHLQQMLWFLLNLQATTVSLFCAHSDNQCPYKCVKTWLRDELNPDHSVFYVYVQSLILCSRIKECSAAFRSVYDRLHSFNIL